MIEAKIQFSDSEKELMIDAEVILTKNRILHKVKLVLENLQNEMVLFSKVNLNSANHEFLAVPPKISKGENYNGLPYLILDYPRNFSTQSIFAIRTMFWWGNFFSITLHLSGNGKKEFLNKVTASYELLAQYHFSIGVNDDPWQHHFEETNYKLISELSKKDFISLCNDTAHIKIAAKWPVLEGASAANDILAKWELLLKVILP